ncbi:MAG TPA: glycoside hydrolase family 3 N-terminal domain-containing protein, partial [Saprospiraceae bacterium]|nr:glycoside hydrolase family 3 N-terminal domain-containing protein [Saprospiraceae bacterium]
QLIDAGLPAMMVAHLHVPAIDSAKNISTTLSSKAIHDLLKTEMGFDGLVFTDALEMKGVTKNFKSDEVAVMAFGAGNDMLVLPEDMDLAFTGLKKAFEEGRLSQFDLNQSVKKILMAKFNLGLHIPMMPSTIEAGKMAFDPYAIGIKHKLIEEAITVVQNKSAFIPIVNVVSPKIATVAIGTQEPTTFEQRLDDYVKTDHYHASHGLKEVDVPSLLKELQPYDKIIISIHNLSNKAAGNYGLTKEELGLIQNINRMKDVILVVFGNPYTLKYFENVDHIIMAYEDQPEIEDITAQGLMGVFGFKGRLPVTASNIFPLHQGYSTPSLKRLGFSVPERVGMVSDSLNEIEKIVDEMIREHAAPGCEILIAKDGRI